LGRRLEFVCATQSCSGTQR